MLDVFVTQANDCQDAAATVGFDDWVDAWIEASANESVDTGQSWALELGIW